MKILIKAIQPHRQRILTADGEEIRLQQWANKKAKRDKGTELQVKMQVQNNLLKPVTNSCTTL